MKMLLPITCLIAVASATHIYNIPNHSTPSYQHAAEVYQSGAEAGQYINYSDQSQAFPNEDPATQRPLGEKSARIISQKNEITPNEYSYGYETENGFKVQEAGQKQGKGIAAQGAYSYTGDDGQVYTVTYTADENGFRAQGAHLPTPPPIPEAIMQSLQLNAKDEAAGVFDDGSYKETEQPSHTNYNQQPIEIPQQYQPNTYQTQDPHYDANLYQHQEFQQNQYQANQKLENGWSNQASLNFEANGWPSQKLEANGWPNQGYQNVGTVSPQVITGSW